LSTIFQEREESVKADIFNAFIALVKHTRVVTSASPPSVSPGTTDAMEMEDTSLSLLMGQVANIVKGVLPASLFGVCRQVLPFSFFTTWRAL